MSITIKELAKKFRESVDFDFSRESIFSYDQILTMGEGTNFYSVGGGDNFYSLTDREAFNALLNDYITDDNQLVAVFLDLYDAQFGLQRLADPRARNSPRLIISSFVNIEKYKFHQTHLEKVYFAINTWLLFCGSNEISITWSKCPVCGSVVRNDACSSCKKTNGDFIKMLSELNTMLQNEKKGKLTATPKYWNDIKPNTEFYNEYKAGIESYRSDRDSKERETKEKEKKIKIAAGENEINSLQMQLNIEAGKEKPDFDSFLGKINRSVEINEAVKYNDAGFSKKLDDLKNAIVKKKQEHILTQERSKHLGEFTANLNRFLQLHGILKQELSVETLSINQLKAYFDEANQLHAKVMADLASGFQAPSHDIETTVKKYNTDLRALIGDHIQLTERKAKLKEQQRSLQSDIYVIENLFNGIGAKDNRSAYISKRFNNEIEHNKNYAEFQTSCKQDYYQMVAPVRERLNKLILEENAYKLSLFKSEAEKMRSAVAAANPRLFKARDFDNRWTEILNNDIYSSIKNNGDVKLISESIKDKIRALRSAELAYEREVQRVAQTREKKKQCVYFLLFLLLFSVASAVLLFVPSVVQALALGLGQSDMMARFSLIFDPLMLVFPIAVVLLDIVSYLVVKQEKYKKSRTITFICGLLPQLVFTAFYIAFYFISTMLF